MTGKKKIIFHKKKKINKIYFSFNSFFTTNYYAFFFFQSTKLLKCYCSLFNLANASQIDIGRKKNHRILFTQPKKKEDKFTTIQILFFD